MFLATHPGRLITKDELLTAVWRAAVLSDGVLANTAAKVRKALGQAPLAHKPLETVRGRGFRWRAEPIDRGTVSTRGPLEADLFVGRTRVMERLTKLIDSAAQGNGQVICLVGDAGMGKTHTLAELGKHARTRGFSVWEGAAYDGGAPAYWLWVEILRSAHADLSRAMFRRHVGSHSWALPLLVPEPREVGELLEQTVRRLDKHLRRRSVLDAEPESDESPHMQRTPPNWRHDATDDRQIGAPDERDGLAADGCRPTGS